MMEKLHHDATEYFSGYFPYGLEESLRKSAATALTPCSWTRISMTLI